jgi:hypothetical protein
MAKVTLSITDNNGEVFSWTASTGTDDEAMIQLAINRVTRHGRCFLEGNASIEQLEAIAALNEADEDDRAAFEEINRRHARRLAEITEAGVWQ